MSSYAEKNKYQWLEDFEAEIVLNEISSDEIKQRLEKHYIGINLNSWIQECKSKIEKAQNDYSQSIKKLQNDIDEIMLIDESLKFEIEGRVKKLKIELEFINNKYSHFNHEISFYIKEFSNKGFCNKIERENLNALIDFILKTLDNSNELLGNFDKHLAKLIEKNS